MADLSNEIAQYENQLLQIRLAISSSPDGPEKENLLTLEADIKELITLTKDSLVQTGVEVKDDLSAEYDLFKAEMAELEEAEGRHTTTIEEELKALEGMKCQAPHQYAWSEDTSYHNALVVQVLRPEEGSTSDDVKVRVMFTNPTHKDMLPCPFYLDGECKFSDDRCRFSHGEWVPFNSLKEYREPNFSRLGNGDRILVKGADNLWHGARLVETSEDNCKVKLESNGSILECSLHDLFPLDECRELVDQNEDDGGESDSEEDTSGQRGEEDEEEAARREDAVRRVLGAPQASALGEWEQYTKGFGSRIMAKLGYIAGDGLGIRGKGRVEPVPVVVLPAGKSLDHCMMLRESAGGDPDLFKADKRFKRKQKKHEESLQRAYEREKKRTDVFSFLNSQLGQGTSGAQKETKETTEKTLKSETSRKLNVTSFQLAEEMKKAQREIKTLQDSLARHAVKSPAYDVIKDKITDKQNQLSQLQSSELKIAQEQEQRRDRKKLTVF